MMKFGIQMYGLRDMCKRDPKALFQNLHESGFDKFEPCVVVGETLPGMDAFWTEAEFAQNLPLLKANGLSIPSCHVFFQDPLKDAPALAAFAKKYGIPQLVIGCWTAFDKPSLEAFSKKLCVIAHALQEVDAMLLIHNGAADVSAKVDGVSAYEWVLDACGGMVFSQLDTGWMQVGGVDPVSFLERKSAVIRSLHHKDFLAGSTGTPDVAIGSGMVDTLACYRLGLAYDVPQIFDQDCGAMLMDAQNTLKFFAQADS
ncbi:MAG: sugar phosphate isomerase/epimerase [Clostridiales bacterium]|nr:sugar phosphate isomerase/epimerase [Clostridiales bacterium]